MIGSDIIQLNLMGNTIVVLDTAEAAIELLERRSSLYSGRYYILSFGALPINVQLVTLDLIHQW
jgi:hypothetical protein